LTLVITKTNSEVKVCLVPLTHQVHPSRSPQTARAKARRAAPSVSADVLQTNVVVSSHSGAFLLLTGHR
jgi:hypothetical protein